MTRPDDAARPAPQILQGVALGDDEFRNLAALIREHAGIVLNDSKKALVSSRLARRLRARQLRSYREYHDLVRREGPQSDEMREMLNCITTNKTDFFRENHHFEHLAQTVFPEMVQRSREGAPRKLRIWSAGCSTGEEPYSIAMTLKARFPETGWAFEILCTDLDTDVVARARAGEYTEDVVAPVPAEYRRRFLRPAAEGRVQVVPELKSLLRFEQLNFIKRPWSVQGPFDVIFCRNVMIYFDSDTQRAIVQEFARLLRPGGTLYLGHSESMQGLTDLYETFKNTTFRRRATGAAEGPSAAPSAPAKSPAPPADGRPGLGAASRPAPAAAGSPAPARAPAVPRGLPRVNVIIGGVRASRDPIELRTLLGSCVTACLHDPVAQIGGMNHFLLPDGSDDGEASTRYGVNAMEMLINDLLKLGADKRRLRAKVFGAAHVLVASGMSATVPQKNAEFVKQFLSREGIPIVGQRLGGSAPVEVLFQTDSGKALARGLGDSVARDLVREESQFGLDIKRQLTRETPGAVELF